MADSKELRFQPYARLLTDPKITGLNVFKDRFGTNGQELTKRKTACGPFKFGFYIFDLTAQAPAKYQLDNEDKQIIKAHRIYLYRDGIRVYPYGESEDDWLRIGSRPDFSYWKEEVATHGMFVWKMPHRKHRMNQP